MPMLLTGDVAIHYEEFGAGYPVLLFAPGGMRSAIEWWSVHPGHGGNAPWPDPTVELAADFRVIAMDQRNAGRSRAPVAAGDGWHSYTDDHVALLDHLGITKCHLIGGCIGVSYALALIERAPARVAAAVLQSPIGSAAGNAGNFRRMFDSWGAELKRNRDDVRDDALLALHKRMFGGDFVFSVSRDAVRRCLVPLLVLPGDDAFHPREIADEIAGLAPDADTFNEWKEVTTATTAARVQAFLRAHTPAE